MSTTIKIRRDTLTNWQSVNPVPAAGELCIVTDTTPQRIKIGDGINAFTILPYLTLPNATTSAAGLMAAADKSKLDAYPEYFDLEPVILDYAGKAVSEALTIGFYVGSPRDQYLCRQGVSPMPTLVTYQGHGYPSDWDVHLVAGDTIAKFVYDDPKVIPPGAFDSVANATSVRIPSFVHIIGDKAFRNTTITKIICEGVCPPKIGSDSFDDFGSVTLSVPAVAKADYEGHAIWGMCGTIDTIENLF